jgi:hypothetical protein
VRWYTQFFVKAGYNMHGSLPHHQNMAHAFAWRFEHLKKAATL